ncbi:F0F1 ATP synthase subunit B [Planctomycetota bacterium]|nr:F0F1 ATP synthase subunit B [Planctomycetota bacterium]
MNLILILAEGNADSWLLDPHKGGLTFWTAITFAIVVVILYRVAWGPLLKALQDREASIEGAVKEAEETRLAAEKVREEYEAKLEGIRQDAQAIINEGEADKKRIIAEAHTRAEKEAQEIKARAERDVHLARDKALSEVKATAGQLGMLIAAKVLAAEVDAAKHKTVIDGVLASYEAG